MNHNLNAERKSEHCVVVNFHGNNEFVFYDDTLVAVTAAGVRFRLSRLPTRAANKEQHIATQYRLADRVNDVLLLEYAYKATTRGRLFLGTLKQQ